MPVYAADIVASMDYLLSQDISRIYVIEGADMDALKEFLDSVVLVSRRGGYSSMRRSVTAFYYHGLLG